MSGAVIFDLDGVLIDSEGLQYQAYAQVLERFGVRVTAEEYARHWISTGLGPEYAVETYRLPVDAQQLRALKQPIYREILRRHVSLMPGAIEALARLHTRFPLGLATNSNRADVSFVVDQFGLERFFARIVTREDYVLPKPNPDAYLTAAAGLHAPPHACLVVEDTYRGILAAHRAGAVPVAVPNSSTRTNDFSLAVAVFGSLDDLTVLVVEKLLTTRHEN
ncbi:MAG: HAD family hydrolase [Candidatus Binatia bacterium]